jgi:hypothetical protein
VIARGATSLLLAGLAAALGPGCAHHEAGAPSPPAQPPAAIAAAEPAPHPGWIVQVVLREARRDGGAPSPTVVLAAADAALGTLLGAALPLDAWAALLPPQEPPAVLAFPDAGPVAQAALDRLRLVAPDPEGVVLLEGEAAAGLDAGRVALVVLRPSLVDGRLSPDPLDVLARLEGTGNAPSPLVLLDLLEPTVEGQPWPADEVIAADGPAAAALAGRFVLVARARREIPRVEPLARELGLDPRRLAWRLASVGR